jgi:hypothetical protein
MPELTLNDQQRYALAGHLDRVSVPQLMWGEATTHSCSRSRGMELRADTSGSPRTTSARTTQDTEQRPDRKRGAQLQPRRQLLPGPSVHPDLAAFAAFAVPNQDRASVGVEVALVQGERFADPQAGAPQHDDQAAQTDRAGVITGGAHHSDDLLDCRRISRISLPLVARRSALVEAGQRRRRALTAAGVQQQGGWHTSSFGRWLTNRSSR